MAASDVRYACRSGTNCTVLGPDVVGRRADDLAVVALLDDVRRPAGGARDHEQRREHRGRHAHHVVGDRREPVEVREHLLASRASPSRCARRSSNSFMSPASLDSARATSLITWLRGSAMVYTGWPKPMMTSLLRDARADVGLGLRPAVVVALLDLEGHLVGAAVLRAAQRADRAGDAGVHVRAGAGDDPRGEGRGVELVLGVQDERGVHGAHPGGRRRPPCSRCRNARRSESSSVSTCDALAVVAEVVPVARASSRRRPPAGRRCRARRRRRGRPSPAARSRAPRRRCASRPSDGWRRAAASSTARTAAGQAAQRLELAPCRRRARRGSAACRGSGGRRSPRTRTRSAISRMS